MRLINSHCSMLPSTNAVFSQQMKGPCCFALVMLLKIAHFDNSSLSSSLSVCTSLTPGLLQLFASSTCQKFIKGNFNRLLCWSRHQFSPCWVVYVQQTHLNLHIKVLVSLFLNPHITSFDSPVLDLFSSINATLSIINSSQMAYFVAQLISF